ncbi:nucleotidyltransferase family protein [Falsiroseomonas sp. CW058]|uniref:nucleotidyltransferase family protein n=1 Tax=Falsiroseomonas sp. CW058 TaxID=3388664 RepID=UPI003D31F661
MTGLDVAAVLGGSGPHLDALAALALAGPPGAWIGAGFVRNAVWDSLAGRVPEVATLADLDVVFLDTATPPARDAAFEASLRAARPLPWSVTNQAWMAAAHEHAPYRDLADALAHWPETATAVAARLAAGRVELLAPHGVEDLLSMTLRPTPAHAADPGILHARMAAKGWRARWLGLRLDAG